MREGRADIDTGVASFGVRMKLFVCFTPAPAHRQPRDSLVECPVRVVIVWTAMHIDNHAVHPN